MNQGHRASPGLRLRTSSGWRGASVAIAGSESRSQGSPSPEAARASNRPARSSSCHLVHTSRMPALWPAVCRSGRATTSRRFPRSVALLACLRPLIGSSMMPKSKSPAGDAAANARRLVITPMPHHVEQVAVARGEPATERIFELFSRVPGKTAPYARDPARAARPGSSRWPGPPCSCRR